jgi:hypothetical protein
VLGFLVACALVRGGLFDRAPYGDVHLYREYGERMRAGELPYRDFFDEYPPLAQPLFLLPTVAGGGYATFFKWTMALCGAAGVALLVACLHRIAASRVALWAAVAAAAVAPLATGPIFLNAYDLVPAALVTGALLALLARRPALAFVLLGAGTALKAYPAAPALVAAAWLYRAEGGRALRRAAVAFCGTVLLATVFFAATGPGGLRFSTTVQLKRGLEVHSLGGALLRAVDGGVAIRNEPPGSDNVVSSGAGAVALLSSLLELGAVALVAVLLLRGPPTARRLVLGVVAAVVAVVAFQKVFSAQYVDWLVPSVPLAGPAASGLLVVVLALTRHAFDHASAVWPLVLRDLLLVGLFAGLVLRLRARPEA